VHISSRCRYGLRAMLYLALRGDERPVPISEIAVAEAIPAPFLERVVAGLRSAGLVVATRGVAGGYRLSRPPEQITAADVVVALDGSLGLAACVHDDEACGRSGSCLSRQVWTRLDEAIAGALAGLTLQDLVAEQTSAIQEREGATTAKTGECARSATKEARMA
jgi:Rrf2 family cysteine metabolism transcriptional repressor